MAIILRLTFLLLLAVFVPGPLSHSYGKAAYDWSRDWSTEGGFVIETDTEGYNFPTAIAFVPEPGDGPKDPLYFVTELRGKVKVVTNDRSIYTFAEDFFNLKPHEELPAQSGEAGLAGICLDPPRGYVFVTFAYQDEKGILRNNIMRFGSVPGSFSLEPVSKTAFTEIFSDEYTSPSHQIGACQVKDGLLYVGVGDGHVRSDLHEDVYSGSQSVDSLLGKIIRMTTDGEPVKDNPFYVDGDIKKARNYVWATGLRNPFGMKVVDGRIYAADNGAGSMDRFLEACRGENYLWDGTEWSIGANSIQVLTPSDGVAQLDYNPADDEMFPEAYRDKFYLARTGNPSGNKHGRGNDRGIVILDYGLEKGRMRSSPRYFVRYTGEPLQIISGLAAGPDGLYFVPVMPDSAGRSAVLKVIYREMATSERALPDEIRIVSLLESHQCYSCHIIYGGGFGNVGPELGGKPMALRIRARLASADYEKSVIELDGVDTEPYVSYRTARREVMQKKGNERIKTWVKYHLLEPRFDNPFSQMPNTGLTENEAAQITDYLVESASMSRGMRLHLFMKQYIPDLKYRYLVYSFILGGAAAGLLMAGYVIVRNRR